MLRAVQGLAELSAEHEGATFYFTSPEHRAQFQEAPGDFAPKFGGYCAFGVAAHKARVPSDPRTFKIYNGELLLFFNDLFEGAPVNTKVLWNQDEQQLYEQASRMWPAID